MIEKKQQTGMYDAARSRVRHAESVEELNEVMRGVDITSNILLCGPFEDGIDPEAELKLLKTVLNRTRKLIKEGKIHR